MRYKTSSFVLRLIAAALLLVVFSPPPVLAQACVIDGTIYRDYNQNGQQDSGEPEVPGIRVTAYGPSGNPVASATSNASGVYTLSGLPDGQEVRVEFTNLPSFLRSGRVGPQSSTTVTFYDCAASPSGTIDFGVNNPGQYCQTNPDMATSCYSLGNQLTQQNDTVIGFPYTAGSVNGAISDFDQPFHDLFARSDDVGAVWGMAYQGASNSLFVSAFMKRHIGFGPGGPGAIYRIDLDTNTTSTFVTLGAGSDPHPQGTSDPLVWARDAASWDAVGKIGLGDMDISDNGRNLYVVNLANRRLYDIRIGIPPAAGAQDDDPIPTPPGCAASDARPFGLAVNDGLVYVGVVCTAESLAAGLDPDEITPAIRANLRAFVYSFNPANDNFNLVLTIPLDFDRRCVSNAGTAGCETVSPADWMPWRNTWGGFFEPAAAGVVYPQPWLTDIEFDNGDMILGFRDRFGDQSGNMAFSTTPGDNNLYLGINAGDILRACQNPGGGWDLESNGACGGASGTGAGNGQGPSGGEFYGDEGLAGFHDELVIGGLAQVPGQPDVMTMVFDPIPYPGILFDAGVRWFNNSTGAYSRAYRVFDGDIGDGDFDDPLELFGKANGLGDIEALCEPAPLEIGNRVWFDANRNGVQDPGAAEFPVPGVTVNLYDAGGTLVATTLTAADGEYYFNESNVPGGLTIDVAYRIRLDNPADYAPGGPLEGWNLTIRNAGSNIHDNDGRMFNGFPTIDMNTGDFGENDHTHDFGFFIGPTPTNTGTPGTPGTPGVPGTPGTPPPNVSIFSKRVEPPFVQPGDEASWILMVTNPTGAPINDVRVTDTIPAPLVIVSASATAGSVTINGRQVVFEIDQLAPGQTVTITIVTRLPANADSTFVFENSASFNSREYNLQAAARLVRAGELVSAGETPWWRTGLLLIVFGWGVLAALLVLRRRRKQA